MKRNEKALAKKPICTGKHVWSHWEIYNYGDQRLIKHCKKCPAKMEISEFMKHKKEMNLITQKSRTFVDLFNF